MVSSSKRSPHGAAGALLTFVGISAAAGLLVAAAVTPAIAVTGMAARSGIDMFENLPSYLEIPELAQKTNIYASNADGSPVLLASFFDQNREQVTWENVSQFAKDAAVSGEDPRFYEHGGIDLQGTVRAAVKTASGSDVQGGSSITQQYVKNVLVEKAVLSAKTQEEQDAAVEAATETTPDRKLKEMRLAIGLEKKYTKDEILLGYLNIAFFGGRVYGIESAALYYFNVHAKDLSIEQAATLLAIVNNPDKFRLDRPDSETNGAANGYAETKERRDYILKNMLADKKITQEQYDAAVAVVITPTIVPPSTGCVTAGDSAFFCDYVYWTLRNDPAFGATEDDRLKLLKQGGLDVYTTLDLDMQAAAVGAMKEYVPFSTDVMDLGATSVSVQVGTGRVLEMTQNKNYSQDSEVLAADPSYSAVNYNTDFEYGGSSGFQPGSTYKVFTLAEWLKEGHSLNESVDARKRTDWGTFRDSCLGNQGSAGWVPGNDEGGSGGVWTAMQNTVNSYNTGFVAMAKQLDLCGIKNMATSFGVHKATGGEPSQNPSAVLGTNEIAPLTMANAFAGIAGQGLVCKPVVIDKVVKQDGTEIAPPSGECAQKVDAKITASMSYAMGQAIRSGTGSPSYGRTSPKVPMIGKTGTTDAAEATWMSGASSKVATTVGVFNASGHVNLRNTRFNGIQAATLRHYIWPRIQSVANSKYGGDDFPEADSKALVSVQATVPDVRGKTMAEAQQLIEAAGFGFQDGGQQDSELPAGVVSGTDITGNAPRGSLISVFTSNGSLVLIPDVNGKTEADASSALKAAGFQVKKADSSVTDPTKVGVVVSMDPGAGSTAKPGTTITIGVGKLGGGNNPGPGGGNNPGPGGGG